MKGHKQLTSSQKDEYGTPCWLFDQLDRMFQFTLDPCATPGNTKVLSQFFTAEENGLAHSWAGERVFMNPPYSQIKKWMHKAHSEWEINNTLVVALVPNRSCTQWYHRYVHGSAALVQPIEGRIQFDGGEGPATFPSIIVYYLPRIVR